MVKSMSLLKREHENKYAELKALMNGLKAQIIRRDISAYCNGQYEEHLTYGVAIAEKVYAKVDDATGGYTCLFIEDRRNDAFLWIFDIEFDTEFYQVDYIFKSAPSLDDLIYVRDIDSEDESMKRFVLNAIDKLSESIEIVKNLHADTVAYTYSCSKPEVNNISGFENVVKCVLEFER